MADITVDRVEKIEAHHGGRGYRELYGVGAFNSTDASGTLPVQPLTQVFDVQLTAIGTVASDEILSGPTTTNGIATPTSGKIPITRTGVSKTSALKFYFRVRGR